jgi:hypothetical protein
VTLNDKIEMNDVVVDVIIDRKVAYGTVGSTPFRARLGNTSPYLGHGKSIWEVSDNFSSIQKRVIARAIWKQMGEDGAIQMSKSWVARGTAFRERMSLTALFPGRK